MIQYNRNYNGSRQGQEVMDELVKVKVRRGDFMDYIKDTGPTIGQPVITWSEHLQIYFLTGPLPFLLMSRDKLFVDPPVTPTTFHLLFVHKLLLQFFHRPGLFNVSF